MLVLDLTKILLNRYISFNGGSSQRWFSSYVQFCSGRHFSERAEAAR